MIKVCVTAAGHQGGEDLCRFLKSKGYYVIGIDINPYTAARFYCDEFHLWQKHLLGGGVDKVKDGADIIIKATSHEIKWFNKVQVYDILKNQINIPQYLYSKEYVWKPLDGSGAKGVEYVKRDEFIMEKLEGEHIDVDVVSNKRELLIAVPKIRRRAYGGTLVEGEIVERPEIVEQIERALRLLPLDGLSVWQFIGGKLLEINPRIAGAVGDYNIVDLWIKYKLGKIKKEELIDYEPPYGQEIVRCMHKVGLTTNNKNMDEQNEVEVEVEEETSEE